MALTLDQAKALPVGTVVRHDNGKLYLLKVRLRSGFPRWVDADHVTGRPMHLNSAQLTPLQPELA